MRRASLVGSPSCERSGRARSSATATADLTALLTADPVEAVRFAEGELGELLADSDAAARLRATVRVYLEENLSPARAARRLGIHQNTVVYRVKQTEELLGHAIEQRRLQLEVALRLSDMIDGLRAAADRAPPDARVAAPPRGGGCRSRACGRLCVRDQGSRPGLARAAMEAPPAH